MLLEVETLGVDEEATDGAALVLGPVVVHVKVEVVEIAKEHVALDAVQRPDVVLDLTLVGRDEHVLLAGRILLRRHRLVLGFLDRGAVGLGRASVGLLAVVVVIRRRERSLWQNRQRGWR